MTVVERTEVEEFLQPSHVPELERHFFIARRLREIVKSDQPHFIYVNKRGSHFSYAKNYPCAAASFLPDMERGESTDLSRERLINSYKNSLRWNVDGFLKELLSNDLASTVVIYTSDHGQNPMDRGVVLQCNSSDPHVFEGLVPLLVTSGDSRLRHRFQEAALVNRDSMRRKSRCATARACYRASRSGPALSPMDRLLGGQVASHIGRRCPPTFASSRKAAIRLRTSGHSGARH
jgi:arylsulfatase A-like enzyme